MTNGEKFMVAGFAAGSAAAGIPVVYGLVRNLMPKPLDDNDFLHTANGGFTAANGAYVCLRGLNLSDEIFFFEKDGIKPNPADYEAFNILEERFGRYGARKLIDNYNANMISASDLKLVKKLGANCVRIPLRYKYLCRKENCKGDIDFDRLDETVAKCKKLGLYVIFDLHSAPGNQNGSVNSGEKSVLFDSGKDGFEARNTVVRIWSQVAAHYKDEPAVAAYDLLNRPLNGFADWEDKLETLHKLYKRIYKAIRNVDPDHIIIMQAANLPESLPSADGMTNVAYGLYSHFRTNYETDSFIKSINALKSREIPFVVCKIRAEANWDYALTALCDNGISWLAGDFKGDASRASILYAAEVPAINFNEDNYDVMTEKWSKPLATKNFTLNDSFRQHLVNFFDYGYTYIEPAEEEKKPLKFTLRFGKNTLIGNTRNKRSRAGNE